MINSEFKLLGKEVLQQFGAVCFNRSFIYSQIIEVTSSAMLKWGTNLLIESNFKLIKLFDCKNLTLSPCN